MINHKTPFSIIILVVVFMGCSIQKQQIKDIDRYFKNVPELFSSKEHLNNARHKLLKEIKSFALGSDTIIIVESICAMNGSYFCRIYASERGIKSFHYECDNCSGGYGADVPRTFTLKEINKPSNFSIEEMQSIKTDVHSFINKQNSMAKLPGGYYFVTFAIKEEKNYVFQFYPAYSGYHPSKVWRPNENEQGYLGVRLFNEKDFKNKTFQTYKIFVEP